jgi:hypothetical protein
MRDWDARTLDLDGEAVPFALRRSDRARRLRAEVAVRGGLRVTLPARMDESRVEPFLRRHRRWLRRALRRAARLAAVMPERTLAHGTTVPFLGRELRLDLRVGPPRVEGELIVHVPRRTRAAVARVLEGWYRARALPELAGRTTALAARHGLQLRDVRVGDPKTRWGTCTAGGRISYSWRILLAPEAVADYLVAHEVAHLAVPDHSPRFWAKVEELCPGHAEPRAWLRRHGPGLVL